MSNKKEVHVKLYYVLPQEERDTWNGFDDEAKNSWTPMDGFQVPEGEPAEYVAMLDDKQIRAAENARNCKSVIEAHTAYAQGYALEDEFMAAGTGVPSQVSFDYLRSDLSDSAEGVTMFILDTGHQDDVCKGLLGTSKIVGTKNYINGKTETPDRNGHGTMSFSLLVPRDGVEVYVYKVLDDNGSGSSSGIVQAIKEAARVARANPGRKYILSGSLGGNPGKKYQFYVDACAEAEKAGVLCRWSAGNDGVRGVGAPANWTENRASIAFNIRDERADFSNYETWCGFATEGERIAVMTREGVVKPANGTSFSLPISNREIAKIAAHAGVSIFEAEAAVRAAARKTPEPFEEESAGVMDVRAAMALLVKSPSVEPAPGVTPSPSIPLVLPTPIDTVWLSHLEETREDRLMDNSIIAESRKKGQRLVKRFQTIPLPPREA